MATPQRPIEAAGTIARPWYRALVQPGLLALACTAGLLADASALARDKAPHDKAPPDTGGWSVAASADGDGCFLTRAYKHPGDTTLLLGIDRDGSNHLLVLNANWSIKPKDRLKLDFDLSSGSYTKHFAIGMASDGKQGFVTSFEAKFPSYFARSKFLDISRGDVPVERLDLDGSGAAVADLNKCVEAERKKPAPAASGKAHGDDVPADPFVSDKIPRDPFASKE